MKHSLPWKGFHLGRWHETGEQRSSLAHMP